MNSRTIAVLVISMFARVANAETEGIVLLSHAGVEPPRELRVLEPVSAELARRGFLVDPALRKLIEDRISLPADEPVSDLVAASAAVRRGYDAFIDGNLWRRSRAAAARDRCLRCSSG